MPEVTRSLLVGVKHLSLAIRSSGKNVLPHTHYTYGIMSMLNPFHNKPIKKTGVIMAPNSLIHKVNLSTWTIQPTNKESL